MGRPPNKREEDARAEWNREREARDRYIDEMLEQRERRREMGRTILSAVVGGAITAMAASAVGIVRWVAGLLGWHWPS